MTTQQPQTNWAYEFPSHLSFTVQESVGAGRTGTLRINGSELSTPNLFPVVSFYGGGTKSSVYGGGIHRTIKEFMIGSPAIGGDDYSEYFDGAMMSVASLTDYGINRNRFEDYIDTPIKERDTFESFNGVLFLDSGGFKFLNGQLDGSDFEMEIDQRRAFDIQQALGGDILVNLDRPITPDDSYETRVEKAQRTAENAAEFLRLSGDYEAARYLTVHGYNYSMIKTFFEEIVRVLGEEIVRAAFDGIALGSLVPKKDDKDELVTAVLGCQEVLSEHGLADLPLHVLGISGSSIPLLASIGVDTFDSSSYLQNAINGKYYQSPTNHVHIDKADFAACDCPVCTDNELVSRMRGNTEYQKDKLGAVAMHNLIMQKRELAKIRNRLRTGDEQVMIDYIDNTVARNDRTRRVAHRIVNETLGGYF